PPTGARAPLTGRQPETPQHGEKQQPHRRGARKREATTSGGQGQGRGNQTRGSCRLYPGGGRGRAQDKESVVPSGHEGSEERKTQPVALRGRSSPDHEDGESLLGRKRRPPPARRGQERWSAAVQPWKGRDASSPRPGVTGQVQEWTHNPSAADATGIDGGLDNFNGWRKSRLANHGIRLSVQDNSVEARRVSSRVPGLFRIGGTAQNERYTQWEEATKTRETSAVARKKRPRQDGRLLNMAEK
ncbi:MAG: hypothetical protein BJ554DRAFT_531, partial [Olpidium bornovanus]